MPLHLPSATVRPSARWLLAKPNGRKLGGCGSPPPFTQSHSHRRKSARYIRKRSALRLAWTVEERRRAERARRIYKLSAEHSIFMIAMYVLFLGQNTPETWREAIAAWLATVVDSCLLMLPSWAMVRARVLFWTHLATEADTNVLESLLLVGERLYEVEARFGACRREDCRASQALCQLLKREHLEAASLEHVMDLLINAVPQMGHGYCGMCPEEHGDAVLREGLRLLSARPLEASTQERLAELLTVVLYETDAYTPPLLDAHFFFSWIFDGLLSGVSGDLHWAFYNLFTAVSCHSQEDISYSLMVRYYPKIVECLATLSMKDLAYAIRHTDYCDMIIATPAIHLHIFRVAEHICEQDHRDGGEMKQQYDEVCAVIVLLHETTLQFLDAHLLLPNLLGTGLLFIAARHFSSSPVGGPLSSHARALASHTRIFAELLDLYPILNGRFKQCTSQGPTGNPIADLGRSLARSELRSADYVFCEDD